MLVLSLPFYCTDEKQNYIAKSSNRSLQKVLVPQFTVLCYIFTWSLGELSLSFLPTYDALKRNIICMVCSDSTYERY